MHCPSDLYSNVRRFYELDYHILVGNGFIGGGGPMCVCASVRDRSCLNYMRLDWYLCTRIRGLSNGGTAECRDISRGLNPHSRLK